MVTDVVTTIRNGLAAWSRGDLDATLADFDPEIEFRPSGLYPGLDQVYRGHDAFRRFWSEFRDVWLYIEIAVDRIVEGEPPLAAMVGRFIATGRDGISVERHLGMVFATRKGLITRIDNYGSGGEALAAAGVRP